MTAVVYAWWIPTAMAYVMPSKWLVVQMQRHVTTMRATVKRMVLAITAHAVIQ